MPRPCTCDRYEPGHDYDAARHCRLCFLYHADAAYRALWDGGPPVSGLRRRAACRHRGAAVDQQDCASCSGRVRLKVYACARHGRCTLEREAPGTRCCLHCPDHEPPDTAPEAGTVRHLLYHVYPLRHADWRWNLRELRRRLGLFNGKRVVADDLAGSGCEVAGIANDPALREVATFEALFERVAGDVGPGDVTLYAHAKGLTRPAAPHFRRWVEVLHATCLDHWPLVCRLLRRHPVVGAFQRLGRGWPAHESRSEWHYSGSWFWFRNRDLFARDWRRIDRFWSGIEPYPSLHFAAAEAGNLFHAFQTGHTGLYNPDYWRTTVEPAWQAWREEHAADRTAGAPADAGAFWLDQFEDVAAGFQRAGVPLATSPRELALLALTLEDLVRRGIPGDVLECGSWTGYSSCCLSLACRALGRRLAVADSFAGLPGAGHDPHQAPGQFACDRLSWQRHLARWGAPGAVDVYAGPFAEALAGWQRPLCLLWLDVDLGPSARDALTAAGPHLDRRGRLFVHKARPEYFLAGGAIRAECPGPVWSSLRDFLDRGRRPYQAEFLAGHLAVVSFSEEAD